jgi:hypothetical protein
LGWELLLRDESISKNLAVLKNDFGTTMEYRFQGKPKKLRV